MIEVNFSIEELATLQLYRKTAEKSPSDWSNDEFSQIKKSIKDHYLKQQNYTCCFCKQRIIVTHNRAWDVEHIISRSAYPDFMFNPFNLCVTCIDCNIEKSNKDVLTSNKKIKILPKKSSSYKIIHPHFDIYDEHLSVIVEGQLYQWKTNKGRATLKIYGLDRFQKTANRCSSPDSDIKKLMMAALTTDDQAKTYEKLELELLRSLALKHSDKIGPQLSIDVIKKATGY